MTTAFEMRSSTNLRPELEKRCGRPLGELHRGRANEIP